MTTSVLHVAIFCVFLTLPQLSAGQVEYEKIAKIKPRSSHEIAASPWGVGGETMDRDYTIFENWKEYLAPLGAKKIRLQAGWGKTDKGNGNYDFHWLDEIVDGVIAAGVEPWLQTSYGNEAYEGGGSPYLGGAIPGSPEALQAWDNWVRAMAKRYAGKVKIWEIWNEPDLHQEEFSVIDYANLYIRTAKIIRQYIPDAKLYALSLAFPGRTKYTEDFLQFLKERDKLHLVDVITFHGYYFNPDRAYDDPAAMPEGSSWSPGPDYYALRFSAEKLRRTVSRYSDKIKLLQGEQGAPSAKSSGALDRHDWTEREQAKWLLRRMLNDWGHDIPANYFGIMDMNYGVQKGDKFKTMNTKGLIKANEDRTVAYLKPSYYAFQHLTSIFDHAIERIPNYHYIADTNQPLTIFGWRQKGSDRQLVTFWFRKNMPQDENKYENVNFQFKQGYFEDPVYVDLRTGEVYEIPENDWSREGTEYSFNNIPVYDSPVIIADKSVLWLEEEIEE